MLIDPIQLLSEILTTNGHQEVHSGFLEARAMSVPEYIFLKEAPGLTPHIRYSDRPSIDILVYSNQGFDESRRRAYQVVDEIQAAQGKPYSSGGIHRVITVLRPGRFDVAGLPSGVGRTSAQVDLILSNREKWS